MKIDSSKPPEGQGPARNSQNVQKTEAVDQQKKAAKTSQAGPKDKVDISARSKEIADIKTSVNQLPEVREAKVQEVKQSVDAGTYVVDPRKVAEKIIKEI